MTGIETYSGPKIELTDAAGFKHIINHLQYKGKVSQVIPNGGSISRLRTVNRRTPFCAVTGAGAAKNSAVTIQRALMLPPRPRMRTKKPP